MSTILVRGNAIRCSSENQCVPVRDHTKQNKSEEKEWKTLSSENTGESHCSKIDIEGLVYLTLTPVVIQSRNEAKMNGSQPDWDARERKS
jgi:hypothetical protein